MEAEIGHLVKEEGLEEPREHLVSNAKESVSGVSAPMICHREQPQPALAARWSHCFTCINSFDLHPHLWGGYFDSAHLIDEAAEAQRVRVLPQDTLRVMSEMVSPKQPEPPDWALSPP